MGGHNSYIFTGNASQLNYRSFKFSGESDSIKALRKEALDMYILHGFKTLLKFDLLTVVDAEYFSSRESVKNMQYAYKRLNLCQIYLYKYPGNGILAIYFGGKK